MKYAVIGTGYWGSNHARVAAQLLDEGEIDSLVLCDVDEERVSEMASSYGVDYTTDYTELPERGVDAATVATPSPTHHEIATRLLEGGVNLLVEKPLALTSDDAWDMVKTAENNGRKLAVGHIFRYHPALDELKKRVDRGELGEIKYINTNRFSFRVPRQTAGALYSLGIHDVDISGYLMNEEPNSVFCELDSFVRDEVDETATIVLEYDEATSVINESWQVPVFGKRRDLTVVGTERAAYLDYLEDNVLEIYDSKVFEDDGVLKAQENGSRTYEVDDREPLRIEVLEFVEAVLSDEEPRVSGEIGARAVEMLELARESDRTGSVVERSE